MKLGTQFVEKTVLNI